jgi:hypothetical protein
MYDWEIAFRLCHGLQIRQLKLGRRMNRPILGDGHGDRRLTRSAINLQAPQQAPQQAPPQV